MAQQILKEVGGSFKSFFGLLTAGISYSIYRRFMHNKQPFSVAKKIKLFKCMNEVKKYVLG